MRMQRREWQDSTFRTTERKFTKQEQLEYTQRCMKRALRAMGRLPEPGVYWQYDFEVDGCRYTGRVFANTKSEARGMLKKEHGIKLPKGLKLVNKGKSRKATTDDTD